MEELAVCMSCVDSRWRIYRDRIECVGCDKAYKWPLDCKPEEATKAQDIINLVNDNY